MFESRGPADPFRLPFARLPRRPRRAAPLRGVQTPSSPLLRARAAVGSPRGRRAAAAPRLGRRWVKGGGGRHPRHSQAVPSQNHALEFVGARGSVPSPFGLLLLLLAFLWDLLPGLGVREGNTQVRHKAGSDIGIQSSGQPAEWHLGMHMYICIYLSIYPASTTWLFMPQS